MANVGPFSIVLLFENQANSLQVVQSLREKGLDVHTVNNASELIQIIAAHKFDLVCLSVNHPSASSLVQVLKIKTHVAVLMFGEDASNATAKAVLKTAADYQVTGAISSYNIWLKIGHLVKEKQRHTETASRMLSGKAHVDEDEAIVIKSPTVEKERRNEIGKVSLVKSKIKERPSNLSVVAGPDVEEKSFKVKGAKFEKSGAVNIVSESDSGEPHQNDKSKEPKQEKKKMLMGAKKKAPKISIPTPEEIDVVDDAPVTVGSVEIKEKVIVQASSEVTVQEKPAAPKGKLMKKSSGLRENRDSGKVMRSVGKSKKNESLGQLTEEQLIDREIDQIQSLFFDGDPKVLGLDGNVEVDLNPAPPENLGNVMIFKGEAPKAAINIESDEQISDNGHVHFSEGPKTEREVVIATEEESSYETEADKIISIEAARAHRKKVREKQKAEKLAAELSPPPKIDRLRFKKVFRDAVAKAGQHRFQRSENTNSIGAVTRISLIPVDNTSERGFIIMANNQNDYTTIDEVSGFKATLVAEMEDFKEASFELGDTFNIETFEVDMAAWAQQSSQFFYMFEDPETGKQMLICFLKKEQLFPKALKMSEHQMHRIDIHELPPKMPVSFDAYLFLARNDKMLPYLRRGGSLTSKQIQRLYKRGFKFLYVKDEEVRDYYEFYLSLSLNQDFRSERKLA